MQQELRVELSAVQRRIPLVVAAVAFVVYLVTLNHDATFSGLVNLAKVVGWDWRPNINSPLQVLVTFPVRFLPPGAQLQALNVISALCAAMALGLLARCVSLLPHDRTRDQRQLERSEHSLLSLSVAWVPPVLAAAVAGLQLSFWENAVVGTGEALDLLVFAWLVHALLMFRLDQRESRLGWFAFVYGLGVTNNYALIAFAPLFLGALIWIRGRAFFNVRFLARTSVLGLAGMLLYLVLPTVALFGPDPGYTWADMVRTYWATQRDSLLNFSRVIVVLLSVTSILPVVFMGIRWPAQFGEVSPLGNMLTNLMTHLIHAIFLVACAYVAFDQYFSPRNLTGGMVVLLPFYFLGALSVGYCTGYFLLVCGPEAPDTPQWQRPTPFWRTAKKAGFALLLVASLIVPGLLAYQNVSQIWANTGSSLGRLSTLAAQSLPREGAVVLSDEPFRLFALEHELRTGSFDRSKFVLVDTRSLENGGYHQHLLRKHPGVWPKVAETIGPKQAIAPIELIQQMLKIAAQRPVYYLHPSFGYFFEYFEMMPKGLVYQLRPLGNSTLSGTVLSAAEMAEGEKFWRQLQEQELDRLARRIPRAEFAAPGSKMKVQTMTLEMYVGRLYSQALNYFGVALQRAGQAAAALPYYELALKLDPYNASAMLNADYNRHVKAGRGEGFEASPDVIKRLNVLGGNWNNAVSLGGPVEEPSVCESLARAFYSANQARQAGLHLERVLQYQPTNVAAWVIYPSLAVNARLPDLALAKIAELRSSALAARMTAGQKSELAVAEATAYSMRNELDRAVQILRAEQARSPGDPAPWRALFELYSGSGQLSNALAVGEQQLKVQPRNVQTLVDVAVLKARLAQLPEAIALLNRALEVSPNDEYALLNRARFHAAAGNLDFAQKDYETLREGRSSAANVVTLGLADILFRKKNNREALRLYRQVLKTLPESSPDWKLVTDRIRQLDP